MQPHLTTDLMCVGVWLVYSGTTSEREESGLDHRRGSFSKFNWPNSTGRWHSAVPHTPGTGDLNTKCLKFEICTLIGVATLYYQPSIHVLILWAFYLLFVKSNTAQRNPCNTHSFKAHQWPTSGWYHFFLLPCSIVLPCPTPRKMRQSFPACHSRSKEQWRLWKAKCRLFREKWQNWKIFVEWMVHEWSHYTTHDLTDWTHTFLGGLPFPDPHFPSLTKAFGKSCIFD